VLDGWWAEAYDGKNGFAIGNGSQPRVVRDQRSTRRAKICTACSRSKSIPLYYERDVDGLPRGWIKRMMNSISSLAWRFSAHRMVMDYVRSGYLPAAGGVSCVMHNR
jgi:starch phosphorylase